MSIRSLRLVGFAGMALTAAGLLVTPPSTAAAPYRAPRTDWGAPSFEGMWTNLSATQLERPKGVTALEIDDSQVAAFERARAAVALPSPADVGQSTSEWSETAPLARIGGRLRTSWITEPADGRLPYSPQGRRVLGAKQAAVFGRSEGPEARTSSDRCLQASWNVAGPPMLNAPYAPNYVIAQSREAVTIVTELLHEVRTVRLDGKAKPSPTPVWMGDSIGHWEGDTLVVETSHFRPDETFRTPTLVTSPDARMTERFTRVSPTEIRYAFTVDDPAMFTQPWKGEIPFRTSKGPIYEYACAEGNYSLAGILAGARRQEAVAAAKR